MDKPLAAKVSLAIALVAFLVYLFFVLARWSGLDAISDLFGRQYLFVLLLTMSALFTISILIYEDIRDKNASEPPASD